MKLLRVLLISSVLPLYLVVAQAESAKAPAPVSSREDVQFVSKKDQPFLDVNKVPEFVGVFSRIQESDKDLQSVDLYSLGKIQSMHMDEALCKRALGIIFGPLDQISLNVKAVEIWTSRTGKTCEAVVVDPDPQGKIPERRMEFGFVKAKPYAVVFKLSKKPDAGSQKNMRDFWDSLR